MPTGTKGLEPLLAVLETAVLPIELNPYGGKSGIRTHGRLIAYCAFQEHRLKPLDHLSIKKLGIGTFFFVRAGQIILIEL